VRYRGVRSLRRTFLLASREGPLRQHDRVMRVILTWKTPRAATRELHVLGANCATGPVARHHQSLKHARVAISDRYFNLLLQLAPNHLRLLRRPIAGRRQRETRSSQGSSPRTVRRVGGFSALFGAPRCERCNQLHKVTPAFAKRQVASSCAQRTPHCLIKPCHVLFRTCRISSLTCCPPLT
jgi:hypothetical protein